MKKKITMEEAIKRILIAVEYYDMVHDTGEKEQTDKNIDITTYKNLGDLEVLSGVSNYPTRIKCAMLGWHTLIAALKKDQHTVQTE